MIYDLEYTVVGPTMRRLYFAKYARGVLDHFSANTLCQIETRGFSLKQIEMKKQSSCCLAQYS